MTDVLWHTWADTHQARPRRTATPNSTEEVAAAVRSAAADDLRVRMVGSGHSFTDVAVTDTLDDRVAFVSCNRGCTNEGQEVTWTLDELPGGAAAARPRAARGGGRHPRDRPRRAGAGRPGAPPESSVPGPMVRGRPRAASDA